MILPHFVFVFVIQFLCDLINPQKIFQPIAPLRLLFRNHEICSRGRKAATTSEPKFKQKRWTTANENGEELLFLYEKFLYEKERIFNRPKVKVGLFLDFLRQIFLVHEFKQKRWTTANENGEELLLFK